MNGQETEDGRRNYGCFSKNLANSPLLAFNRGGSAIAYYYQERAPCPHLSDNANSDFKFAGRFENVSTYKLPGIGDTILSLETPHSILGTAISRVNNLRRACGINKLISEMLDRNAAKRPSIAILRSPICNKPDSSPSRERTRKLLSLPEEIN